jgi:hypothetical protein
VLAVGAFYWDGGAGNDQGAVYVFDWTGLAWTERTTALTPSDAGAYDWFGKSCALSADGSVLAVGAIYWDGSAGANQGCVYVFDWTGSAWTERTTALTPSDAGSDDRFGSSCALSADGSVLAVGAYVWDGSAGSNQGAVYIYDVSGSDWLERADQTWHHIGFTLDGTDLLLYMDAVEQTVGKETDAAISAIHTSTADLTIGSALTNNIAKYLFEGGIAYTYLNKRELSADEVNALYLDQKKMVIKDGIIQATGGFIEDATSTLFKLKDGTISAAGFIER